MKNCLFRNHMDIYELVIARYNHKDMDFTPIIYQDFGYRKGKRYHCSLSHVVFWDNNNMVFPGLYIWILYSFLLHFSLKTDPCLCQWDLLQGNQFLCSPIHSTLLLIWVTGGQTLFAPLVARGPVSSKETAILLRVLCLQRISMTPRYGNAFRITCTLRGESTN